MAVLTKSLPSTAGRLRPFDVRRDLKSVADLVEICFKDSLDQDGQRYLKQMRDAARSSGLLQWASAFSEGSGLPISGYVWEEQGRLVGNLSLMPFNQGGQRIYLIANVAVHPDFRRRGIARALTAAAQEYSRQHRARSVWLQVRQDNEGAIQLYRSLGFAERARRTTWRNIQGGVAPASQGAGDASPGAVIGPRRDSHWPQHYAWLQNIYPPDLAWHFPFRMSALRADLWGSLYCFFSGTSVQHWVAQRGGRLLGILTWQTFHTSADVLWLATPTEVDEAAIHSLLVYARQRLSPRRPLALDYPAGRADESIHSAGFEAHSTLIWMEDHLA